MTKVKEIWKSIPKYEGRYEVSNLGRIRTIRFGRISVMRPHIHKGYCNLNVTDVNGVRKNMRVHRLVALAFIPNPENKPFINHKDCNRANNRIENLEWCNMSENVRHGYKYNENRGTTAKRVVQMDLKGKKVNEFSSLREARDSTMINSISKVCNGHQKTAGGFKWRHVCQ